MAKIVTINDAAALVKDGMTVMVGGFLGCGAPDKLMHALALSGVKDLTVICNDGGLPGGRLLGVQELIHNGQGQAQCQGQQRGKQFFHGFLLCVICSARRTLVRARRGEVTAWGCGGSSPPAWGRWTPW